MFGALQEVPDVVEGSGGRRGMGAVKERVEFEGTGGC